MDEKKRKMGGQSRNCSTSLSSIWNARDTLECRRYAGRKAVESVLNTGEPVIDRSEMEAEKDRVYAPIRRKDGIEWKELEAGIAWVMQDYCGLTKNE